MLKFKAKGYKGAEKAEWDYDGFNDFRKRLASEAGIDLDEMRGFGGKKGWSNVKSELTPLLKQCRGKVSIKSKDCGIVARKVNQIVSDWDSSDNDRMKALMLVSQMKYCFSKKRTLTFRLDK